MRQLPVGAHENTCAAAGTDEPSMIRPFATEMPHFSLASRRGVGRLLADDARQASYGEACLPLCRPASASACGPPGVLAPSQRTVRMHSLVCLLALSAVQHEKYLAWVPQPADVSSLPASTGQRLSAADWQRLRAESRRCPMAM